MKLSIQSVEVLRNIILDIPYRSGSKLVEFFNQFGFNDEHGGISSSRWIYAQNKILELNDTEKMVALVEQAVDPRNFKTAGSDAEETIRKFNEFLEYDGYELIKDGLHYRVHRKLNNVVEGNPVKNLIFASIGPKPELVLRDALNNDVEIVKNGDYCLIYDHRISDDGLSWSILVQWWAQLRNLSFPASETERNLYSRLLRSLGSEPEKLLFKTYFGEFRPKLGDNLPALIPQVYLHYDPKTLQELNGIKRLPRQRMDFLMLLPGNHRIVIEVDGKQHYSDDSGQASTQKYAEMVAADRELRLTGYEVYRFGGLELAGSSGENTVLRFFEKLLNKYPINN